MNTKLFGLFIALLVCLPSFAQQKPVEKVDSDGIYLMPDQMPEFPGGMQAMMKFLTTNIKYPVEAQKKGRGGCEEEKISWTVQEEPAAGGDACYGNASWNEYYIGLCR